MERALNEGYCVIPEWKIKGSTRYTWEWAIGFDHSTYHVNGSITAHAHSSPNQTYANNNDCFAVTL